LDIKVLLQRENDRVQDYIVRSCSDLTDEQVTYEHDAVDERGIGNIVSHLYGSVLSRSSLVTGHGAIPQPTDPPRTLRDLLSYVDDTHKRVATLLDEVTEEQLGATVTVGTREMTGIEALMQGYSHAARHVGNILDARHLGGFETHALG
jgi:hypothetical protein